MIGQRIKEIRNNNNLTQQELADGIISRTYLSLIEKGSVQPSTSVLIKLSEKLNCSVNDFMSSSTTYQYNEMELLKDLSFYELKAHQNAYDILTQFIEKDFIHTTHIPEFDLGRIQLLYSKYYLHHQKYQKANIYVDEALKLLSRMTTSKQFIDAVLIKATLNQRYKQYQDSLDILEKYYIQVYNSDGYEIERFKMLFLMAENYYYLEQYITANRYIMSLCTELDYLDIQLINYQIELLRAKVLTKLKLFEKVLELEPDYKNADVRLLQVFAQFQLGNIKDIKSKFNQLSIEREHMDDEMVKEIYDLLKERIEFI